MKFEVFKGGHLVDKFRLCGAYLFGTDGIGIRRAQITFKNGVIECKKPNLETAGLALLWPIDGFGRVLLTTTCLPERKRPYNLNVEIARAKLMQIVNKREDWSFLDGLEAFGDSSKEAQKLFINAIQHISDESSASKLADESLKKAVAISEQLAVRQAEVAFRTRGKSHGFGRGCLGCRIDAARINEPRYVDRLLELFGSVTVPINWAAMEPQKGEYDFSTVDACMNVLGQKRLSISAGPLLCFAKNYLPRWLLRGGAGFEKIREAAYQFISKVVTRYAGIVRSWRAVSALNVYNHFGFRFEQVLQMTRAACMAVKASSDRTVKIIEIANPWGEYYATTANSVPPLVYMDMVVQSGINFDAFGLQLRFGRNESGMHVRDMMQISALLDYFTPIAKPLHVTGVEVPSRNGQGLQSGLAAGIWHDEWDQARQAEWIEQFFKIGLSKALVERVTYSNLADTPAAAIADSGLLTEDLKPKESFHTLKRLCDSIFIR